MESLEITHFIHLNGFEIKHFKVGLQHHLSGFHRDVIAFDGTFNPGIAIGECIVIGKGNQVAEPNGFSVGRTTNVHFFTFLQTFARKPIVLGGIHNPHFVGTLWIINGIGSNDGSGTADCQFVTQ